MNLAALVLVATTPMGLAPETLETDTATHAALIPSGVVEPAPNPVAVVTVSTLLAGSVFFTAAVAWWDKGWRNYYINWEGFYGAGTESGGLDKCGHLFSAYASHRAVTSIYESLGYNHDTAKWISAGFTSLVWDGFKVVDGFTHYGTSPEDVLFNEIGVAVGLVMESFPDVDRLIGIRIGYVPTQDFLAHDRTPLKLINDYTGMEFYYDVKLKGLFEEVGLSPGPLQFFRVGVMYSTNRYSPIRKPNEFKREFGFDVSISPSELLRFFGEGDEGVEKIATFFDYYAPPFLTVALLHDFNNNFPEKWYLNFGIANRFQVGW